MPIPEADPPTGERFRMRRTVGAAYRSFLDGFDQLLTISWPWLAATWPFGVIYGWLSYPALRALARSDAETPPPPSGIEDHYWLIWSAVTLLPLSAIAVKWHRHLLLQEQPIAELRIDRAVLPYTAMAVGLTAMVAAPIWIIGLWTPGPDEAPPPLVFAALLAFLFAFIAWGRLAVALPGIAVGGPVASLGAAWRGTRGYTLKLLLGSFLAAVPLFAVALLSQALVRIIDDRAVAALFIGTLEMVNLLLLTIGVSFLSFAWRHFFGRAP